MIKIKHLIIVLILLFLLFLISLNAFAQQRILVLHSYHQGLEWTDEISESIKIIFSNKDEVKLYFDYLDTKRNYSQKYYDKLISLYREKTRDFDFDAIIVSDNEALNFCIEHREELYAGIPIIFCGVNNFNEDILRNENNIYGVVENIEHEQILDLILKLHPDLEQLIIINDKSWTGNIIREELNAALKGYKEQLNYKIWDSFTVNELQNRLINLDQNSVIYLLVFNRDQNNRFVDYEEGINLIKAASDNPLYGSWDFYLGNGIVGGKLISAEMQGRKAALLAKKIINNNQDINERIVYNNNNYIFDYLELKKHNIKEEQLPKESKIINKPKAFLERNQKILVWILYFLLLIILILLIFFYIKNKEKSKIDKLNIKLEAKVEERTRELRKISITDDLTNLFNRRHILELLEIEIEKANRYNRELSIIMSDIDFFKKINDNYGHQCGDLVLRQISDILKENTRNIDMIGRYGGEEFLIILPETNLEKAYLAAEKLRKKIKETKIDNLDSDLTISSGVVQLQNELSHQLIKRTDDLLYKAKANGRDRIER